MAQQRNSPNVFPTSELVDQCNQAFKASILASAVQVAVLKSRKHATAGIQIIDRTGGNTFPFNVPFIAKHYNLDEMLIMKREREVLAQSSRSGIPVPRVLASLGSFLLLEKVEGTTLMDLVNSESDFTVKEEAIKNLATWLCRFHQAFKSHHAVRRRGDANLRNFIVNERNAIIGVDFEEAGPGSPITDLHEVVDSLLQSDPGIYSASLDALGWKFELCETLFQEYVRASGEHVDVSFKDRVRFLEGQMNIMKGLAKIRGISTKIEPLLAGIKAKMHDVLSNSFP